MQSALWDSHGSAEGCGRLWGRGGGMSHLRRVEGFLEHKAPGLGAEDQEGKFY